MESQKSQAKLTRTQSSLLRSSTIRSSIHSLNSITESDINKPLNNNNYQQQVDEQEDDILLKHDKKRKPGSVYHLSRRIGSGRNHSVFSKQEQEFNKANNARNLEKIESLFEKTIKANTVVHRRDKDGEREEDCFKDSERRVEFYSNGDMYEGEFHKGKCNGSGVYNFFINGRYEGEWVDGKYDGYGIESWARGSRYKGQYRQGLRHGYGVYRFYTGDSYAGQWCNGQSHGTGLQTCADASSYIGNFKCGMKHGLGVYNFRNGDRYAGEYFGDKIHGFGVYHFANGHCYEGSWHEGRKQGYGMYTFRSGDTKCGDWDRGTLYKPLPPQSDAVLRAVLGARKAAENAIHVCRVDEQVNKAVLGANRAATAARVAAVKAVQNRVDGKFCDTDV
ncbi:hypothetical protein Q3G72_013627 [Acer saccharum]|nr:hypothetical protein Q3G72_013627 [Acer saccharum]